jgi:hypothetical protein
MGNIHFQWGEVLSQQITNREFLNSKICLNYLIKVYNTPYGFSKLSIPIYGHIYELQTDSECLLSQRFTVSNSIPRMIKFGLNFQTWAILPNVSPCVPWPDMLLFTPYRFTLPQLWQ